MEPGANTSTVLFNARVITMDRHSRICEALVWRDGRIAAVGADADMLEQAGSSAAARSERKTRLRRSIWAVRRELMDSSWTCIFHPMAS